MRRPSRYEAARDPHAARLREDELAKRRASHAARQRPAPLPATTVAVRVLAVAGGIILLSHVWPHLPQMVATVAGWIP